MILTYRYRLYPNKEQRDFLDLNLKACLWFYNYALSKKIEYYEQNKKTLSRYDIQRDLPILKTLPDTEWLGGAIAQSLQNELRILDKSYTGFFKLKKGFPKFKKYKKSFGIPQAFSIRANKLYIPKLNMGIKVKLSREYPEKPRTLAIVKKNEKYFACLSCNIIEAKTSQPTYDTSVGLDMGIKDLIITSDGEKYPKFEAIKIVKSIKRIQRRLARMDKGSRNYDKYRLKLSRLYERLSNKRKDNIHNITRYITTKYQTICIEDLNIGGMMKNHCLAKGISNASWYEINKQLEYKAKLKGKNILKIGRFEPSSKTCSCGYINGDLKLSEREWTCIKCGLTHDRDILAANNIKKFAFDKQNTVG